MRSDHLSKHMKRHQNPSSSQKRSNTKNSTSFLNKKNKNPVSPSSSSSIEEQFSQFSTKTFNSESSDCF